MGEGSFSSPPQSMATIPSQFLKLTSGIPQATMDPYPVVIVAVLFSELKSLSTAGFSISRNPLARLAATVGVGRNISSLSKDRDSWGKRPLSGGLKLKGDGGGKDSPGGSFGNAKITDGALGVDAVAVRVSTEQHSTIREEENVDSEKLEGDNSAQPFVSNGM